MTQETSNSETVETDDKVIFETKFKVIMDQFGELCEEYNIKTAVTIAKLHDIEILFAIGSELEVGMLAAKLVKNIRRNINEKLDC